MGFKIRFSLKINSIGSSSNYKEILSKRQPDKPDHTLIFPDRLRLQSWCPRPGRGARVVPALPRRGPQCEGGRTSCSFPGGRFPRHRIEGVGWMAFRTPFNQKDLSQLEMPPLKGRFGRQKKWTQSSGWGISYLWTPSRRTVLHCSSRTSLFDTFLYWLVLLKRKGNEASDNETADKNVGMPCQVWVKNQCASTSSPQSGSSAFEFSEPSIWSGNARSRHSQQQTMECTCIKNTFSEILPGRQLSWNWF